MSIPDVIISNLISVLVIGFLGALLTAPITARWSIRQKRREIELETAHEFYQIYGEFFAIWKLWNYYLKQPPSEENKWDLFKRTSAAEGTLESIIVKLTSEKELSTEQIEILGRFRQGYQTLRGSIVDGKPLNWSSSEHPEYKSFKRLSGLVSNIVLKNNKWLKDQNSAKSNQALLQVTANIWEKNWSLTEEDWERLSKF